MVSLWIASTPGIGGELRSRVVVYDLVAAPDLETLTAHATERILLTLGTRPDLTIIGIEELKLLAEHVRDRASLEACEEERECMELLHRATDADRMVTGRVGRFDRGYLLTLALLDLKNSAFVGGESCFAREQQELTECTAAAALRLFAAEGEPIALKTSSVSASRLAVLDLDALGVPPALAGSLTQLLSLELRKIDAFQVIQPKEVTAMLDYEVQKQIALCQNDKGCLLEIAGALGVDYLVGGAVGKLDDTYVIHLKLMDVLRGEVVRRASESFRGEERHLAGALRFAARSLLGRMDEGEGLLRLDTAVDDALVSIDGGAQVSISSLRAPRSLPAGKHSISIHADDHETLHRDVFVDDRTLTRFDAELTPIPSAWYEQWWVWTIVGAAASAAIATAVLVSVGDAPPGNVSGEVPYPRTAL